MMVAVPHNVYIHRHPTTTTGVCLLLLLRLPAGTLTDELLTAHEGYLDQLTAAIEDLRPLLKSIEKRDELKADKAEYEAIIADPSRLLARGNSSA